MNRSQKKEVRKIKDKCERADENKHKTRGGRPTKIHSTKNKNKNEDQVDQDDYIDFE